MWAAARGRGVYAGSTEELLPWHGDWRTLTLPGAATLATLVRPSLCQFFTDGAVGRYALAPQGWHQLLAAEPLDMVETMLNIDTVTLRQSGIAGSAVLKDRTILVLDIFELAGIARPEWAQQVAPAATVENLADDSDFFRGQIQRLAEAAGGVRLHRERFGQS